MDGDEAFLRNMLEIPSAGTRLVWSDWLEEHGDPRAEHYRECTEFVESTNDIKPGVPNDLAIIWNAIKNKITIIEVYYNDDIYTVRNVYGRESNLYWLMNGLQSSKRPIKISESIVPLVVVVAAKYAIMDEAWPSIRHRNPCREIPIALSLTPYTEHEEDDNLVEQQMFYDADLGECYEPGGDEAP